MAVTIPRLNSQTKASTTAAKKTAVSADIKYRDFGMDDALVGAMKDLGEAAFQAKENRVTGISNATYNEVVRRATEEYTKAIDSKDYRGYNAEDFMGVMRQKYDQVIADIRKNGFVRRDGVTVPALSDADFAQKLSPRVDAFLIRMDSDAIDYAKSEMAIAEKNDFDAAVETALLSVVNTDDPILQASVSNELDGLHEQFYGGRMSEEARALTVHKLMQKAMGTYAENLVVKDPARALHTFKANPNFAAYGVDLTEPTNKAVSAMAELAGTNDALALNGMEPLNQNWTDQPIKAFGETMEESAILGAARKAHPYAASVLMTPEQYAKYSLKRAETATAKGDAYAKHIMTMKREKDTHTLGELYNARTVTERNKIIETAAEQGDAHTMGTIKAWVDTENEFAVYENDIKFLEMFSNPDGTFNEDAANSSFGIAYGNMQFPSERAMDLQRLDYNTKLASKFIDVKERVAKINEGAVLSAQAFEKAADAINSPTGPRRLQDVENWDVMVPSDRMTVANMLAQKAATEASVATIERNEGGTFDLTEIAKEQWRELGHKTQMAKDKKLLVADNEAFNRFNARFRELYVKAYNENGGKVNEEQLREITINAYDTYKKPGGYKEVSRLTAKMNRKATNAFSTTPMDEVQRRGLIKETLEAGRFYSPEVINKSVEQAFVESNPSRAAAIEKISGSLDKGVQSAYAATLGKKTSADLQKASTKFGQRGRGLFAASRPDLSDEEEDLLTSLMELYDELDYNDREILVDMVATGNNSAILRVLKAKGKI